MRLPILALLIAPALSAQGPVRYRFVTTRPAFATPTDSSRTLLKVYADQRTTAPLTMITYDSAGGTVFQFTVDSSQHEYIALDNSFETKQRLDKMKALPPAQFPEYGATVVHRVLVQNGRPVNWSTTRVGNTPRPIALDTSNPFGALLYKLPGIGLLVPNAKLPTTIGAVRADTFISNRTPSESPRPSPDLPFGLPARTDTVQGILATRPPIALYDTVVVLWTRKSIDVVEAQVTKRTVNRSPGAMAPGASTPAPPSEKIGVTTGVYRIVYDARGIQSATITLTEKSTSTALDGSRPTWSDTNNTTYSLVRIP